MGTGQQVLDLAAQHLGERYVLGAFAPKDNAAWKGPWDCAEFASWCLYQACGVLFGCDQLQRPATADAYTGYWQRDAQRLHCATSIGDARSRPGAFLLRYPAPGQIGHIAISDGRGGTVEAHSTATGVIRSQVDGRRWDLGVLPPDVDYPLPAVLTPSQPPAALVLRFKQPPMRGPLVQRLQQALAARGFTPGEADGIYGAHTAAAVKAFQLESGLVADGEAGPKTLAALGLA